MSQGPAFISKIKTLCDLLGTSVAGLQRVKAKSKNSNKDPWGMML